MSISLPPRTRPAGVSRRLLGRPFETLAALAVATLAVTAHAATSRSEPQTRAAKKDPGSPRTDGVRTIYLVRHGAYAEDDPADPEIGRHLVPLGHQQARLVAARLAALLAAPEALHASPMTRARETADIVGRRLRLVPALTPDLRECTPPRRQGEAARAPDAARAEEECRQQLERAFARFLVPSPARDRGDVLVAHGNVIRYLACRALGVDPEAWAGFGVTHTGVTVIEVRPDGGMKLLSHNDVGHLPAELRTQQGTAPLAPARAHGR